MRPKPEPIRVGDVCILLKRKRFWHNDIRQRYSIVEIVEGGNPVGCWFGDFYNTYLVKKDGYHLIGGEKPLEYFIDKKYLFRLGRL